MKKLLTFLLIVGTLAMVGWGLSRSWRERRRAADLFAKTSDAAQHRRTVTIAGDDWLGYLVLRSPRFARALADQDIGVRWVMEPDFGKRLAGLRDGRCDFAAVTLDSYLANGNATGWPGTVLFVVDESFGGDAVLARDAGIKNLDDLNVPGRRGAFVGWSPSEFLLRSQISHFRLDHLRPGLEASRVDTVEKAYGALQSGQVNFAVLWEPLVTKALKEIPGAHVLMDTRNAQGLVIDIALASRRVLAEDPALAETVTRAYFTALHDYLNDAAAFTEAAARDAGKNPADAATMLRGIRFATLDDNAADWLAENRRDRDAPRLADSVRQIQAILRDHGQRADLPNDDPSAILFRGTLGNVARHRDGIVALTATNAGSGGDKDLNGPAAINVANVTGGGSRLGEYYAPLTAAQWNDLSQQVRGTLLDEPIVFRPGQAEIPEDFQTLIREAVPRLANYPNFRVVVEAHVSPGDSPEADQALSEARALEVKRFLMWECRVPEERVLARGRGSAEPPQRFANESQASWERRARRARVYLVGK